MKLTTTVSHTAALTPQHTHRIRLNDEKAMTVGTALTWTFAHHESQPHGVTQIAAFSAGNTRVAMHLHGAIASTVYGRMSREFLDSIRERVESSKIKEGVKERESLII